MPIMEAVVFANSASGVETERTAKTIAARTMSKILV
jgi:hypothetical protein